MFFWAESFLRRRQCDAAAVEELVGIVWRDGFESGSRAKVDELRTRFGLEDDARAAAAAAFERFGTLRAPAVKRTVADSAAGGDPPDCDETQVMRRMRLTAESGPE